MKAKHFSVAPGWGDGDIGVAIDNWLENKNIEIIKLEYAIVTQKKPTESGWAEKTIHNAILIYKEL